MKNSGVYDKLMRAVRVSKFGGPQNLRVEKIPVPKPGENEVLIKVESVGVNPVDTYIREGVHAIKPNLPYTPGKDCSGVVQDVGSKVTDFKIGDRVFTVNTISGAYAQYTTANSLFVSRLSNNLSWRQGAAIGVPYYTAYKALVLRARVAEGETVLIHGASGAVGSAAVQLAKSLPRIQTLGTGGTEGALTRIKEMGADFVFNHREKDYQNAILKSTSGEGVDVILEMAAEKNLQSDLSLLKYNGRVMVIGCRGSLEINPRLTMNKDSNIMGVGLFTTPTSMWPVMHKALTIGQESGWLRPHLAEDYTLEQSGQAHEDVINNTGSTGKLTINPNE